MRRDRRTPGEHREITVASDAIGQRTAAATVTIAWGMGWRVLEARGFRVFKEDRLRWIDLPEDALAPEQAAEMAAFPGARRARPGPTRAATPWKMPSAMPVYTGGAQW